MGFTFRYLLILHVLTFSLKPASCSKKFAIVKILNAIEKIIHFYQLNYNDINLDGLFGLRIIEGQLIRLLEKPLHPSLTAEHLKALKNKCFWIIIKATSHVEMLDIYYFAQLENMVKRPWILRHPYQHINPFIQTLPIEDWELYDEKHPDTIDDCYNQILNLNVSKEKRCMLTPSCFKYLTSTHFHGYLLSHQLLYTMIAESVNCHDVIDKSLKSFAVAESIYHFQTELCTKMYYDSVTMIKTFPGNRCQDLFLEHIFFCGTLGYVEFLSDTWLEFVLNFQDASGCYGIHSPTKITTNVDLHFYHNNQANMRKLLKEHFTKDGCLAHKTAVGAGALMAFLHFINDYPLLYTEEGQLEKALQELRIILQYFKQLYSDMHKFFVATVMMIIIFLLLKFLGNRYFIKPFSKLKSKKLHRI